MDCVLGMLTENSPAALMRVVGLLRRRNLEPCPEAATVGGA